MRCLISQIILTISLFGCLQVEKKNQTAQDETSGEVQVFSQPEFILNERMTLTEDTIISANRVYLTKNAAIFTKKFNLKIYAQVIESELGAIITHYGYDQVASVNQNGQDGGHIEIESDTAYGDLELVASSEKGGNGLNGWGPTQFRVGPKINQIYETIACSPGSGKNSGKVGSIQFQTNNSQNLKLSCHVFNNLGGETGQTISNYTTALNSYPGAHKSRTENCSEKPAVGKSAYGGQVCTKLQNQNNFECIN